MVLRGRSWSAAIASAWSNLPFRSEVGTPLSPMPPTPGDPYRADHLVEGHLEMLLEDTKNPLAPELKRVRACNWTCNWVSVCVYQ